jgi:replicative DNA helicase
VEERDDRRPTLSDLRESGNIEQTSDVCIFMYRDFYYTEDPLTEKDCEFIVAKNRAGRVGTANVHVDLDYQRFSDLEGDI